MSASDISENTVWNYAGYIPTKAVDGNSLEELTYTFIDDQANWANGYPSTTYYRILQFDNDSEEARYASEILAVNHKNATDNARIKFDIYPNPVENEMTVELEGGSAEVFIYDIKGVMLDSFKMSAGKHFVNIDYKPGTYFIKIGDEVRSFVKM